MKPPVTVNTSGSYVSSQDCAGVTPEAPHCVGSAGSSNGISVVPKDQCSLLNLPQLPILKLLGYLSFREILATAKTCTYLNQVITNANLLARRWFATLAAHQQNQFKEIARDISDPDLQYWLGQFTMDTTVADKLYSQCPGKQTTDDDLKTCEAQKRKYFPQVLFYTVGQLMANCRQFKPVLTKSILNNPDVNTVSFSTHGDHLVIFRNNHTWTIFGFTAYCQWNEQAGFSYHSWVNPPSPTVETSFMTSGHHVLAWDGYHVAKIFACNADNSCTEQLSIVHKDRIISADLSDDGHQVVITCYDGSAKIHSWNVAGHWTLAADIADGGRGLKACFSPDGSRVLTHSDSCTKIHRRNGEGGWTLEATSNFDAKSVTFSPDGNQVLMFGVRGMAKILSLNKDGCRLDSSTLGNNKNWIIRATISPDGCHVITVNHQNAKTDSITLKIFSRDSNGNWTEKTGNIPIINPLDPDLPPKFSPDGCHVMAAKDLSNLEILSCDKHGNWMQNSIPLRGKIKRAFFSPDSSHAVVIVPGHRSASIYGFNAARGWIEKNIIRHDHNRPQIDASFSADGRHIVTFCCGCCCRAHGSAKYHAKIYGRTGNGNWRERAIITHTGPIRSARFNADGSHIVTASADGTAVILGRYADGSWVNKAILKHSFAVRSAIFSVDSRQVVTVSGKHIVNIWRLVNAGRSLNETMQAEFSP
ncbi:F-box protein [Endozoicomonas sp. GU-1]|uniref:F-box/WD repeat-containing protein n=1 Tax=Endozoicomonas sp. GU-1 TaxID=3009078 RepID=UPI0022B3A493|nr:F-box protein [Endozoicomonas sp. GU-1]WBA81311.1 hypothetical protein O2T12_23985 [Endozoicomonas sp. GU-1]